MKWKNLSFICTKAALAIIGVQSGFAKKVRELAPGAMSVHCQAPASSNLPSDLQSALNIAIKMVSFMKKSALNTRLFSKVCKDTSANYTTPLYHTVCVGFQKAT